ncbi:MAG: hypothetical protein RLZZ306_2712 [Bacteroidota bacterium]|jgi:hypothetical protein
MKNLTKILLSIYVAIMLIVVACKKEEPTPTPPVTTPTTTPPVVKSSAKDISKFSFAALSPVVDATIDASTKAVTATVPAATDLTKLVPTITISDKATVSPATGVAQDFSKEVSYTVTAEDGGTMVWKVNVKKEAVTGSTNITITQRQKLPTVSDMGPIAKMFSVNSKIYYLGNSKESFNDFKYFFEYDLATDKWTRKADFPFKANLFGDGLSTNFIHNGKAYFSSGRYGFMEYDPIADKWTSLDYRLNAPYIDDPVYYQGSLFIITTNAVSTYEFDTKKGKSYSMVGGANVFSNGVRRASFFIDNKIYIQTYTDETATTKQRFDIYEVDYTNGKYIKKASFEGEQKYNTMGSTLSGTSKGNSFSLGYLIDDKIYNFSTNNVLTYNIKNDAFLTAKSPQNFSSYSLYFNGSGIVIGKSIYVLDYSNAVVSMLIP